MTPDRVLVVLASAWDASAHALVGRWAGSGARLLTPGDLSVAGWRYQPGRVRSSSAVIANDPVPASTVAAVLTRLVAIGDRDLPHITPEDQPYVAAEMGAFLLSWLSELPCPVVNRPTATCLAGPGWRPEQWALLTSRLGIRVHPMRRQVVLRGAAANAPRTPLPQEALGEVSTVTVVGGRAFGDVHPSLARHSRRIADASGTDFLSVCFTSPAAGAAFVGASPFPDIDLPDVADALLALLLTPHARMAPGVEP